MLHCVLCSVCGAPYFCRGNFGYEIESAPKLYYVVYPHDTMTRTTLRKGLPHVAFPFGQPWTVDSLVSQSLSVCGHPAAVYGCVTHVWRRRNLHVVVHQ
jgi:hypothetical protein